MDKNENKICLEEAPDWTKEITEKELVELTKTTTSSGPTNENITCVCFLHRRVFRTSPTQNEDYYAFVYRLDTPELLQGAAINDYLINKEQRMVLHRLGVIRNGEYLDKQQDSLTRVLDDESQSAQGSINQQKKVHIMVSDFRLGDVLVLEYSIITEFLKENCIDPEYLRFTHNFPQRNWLTTNYTFAFINDRAQDVAVKKRYFRHNNGKLVEETKVIHPKETFLFEEKNFQTKFGPDEMAPFFEIATVASWKYVYRFLQQLYKPALEKDDSKIIGSLFKILFTGVSDEESKIRKIIEYVQEHIVYNFDADVMHGHIPQSIDETLKSQAGDCKAKSLLLIKLLSHLGIKAKLVLVNYNLGFYTNQQLPSPFVFDHMIAKIYFKDKVYFADPTWKGQRGILEKRTQPFAPYYLEIGGSTILQTMPEEDVDFYLEENINIEIKKGVGKLQASTIYRYASADNLRLKQRNNSNLQRVQDEIKYHFDRLQYPVDKPINEYITDAQYKIIEDNEQLNEIKDLFTATLPKPYTSNTEVLKIFKYYNNLDLSNLNFPFNKDAILGNFVDHSRKFILTVHSDKFYKRNDPVTSRNTEIKNDYFKFSNKKKLSFRTVKVVAEYKPKISKPIDPNDLEQLKNDYAKINDSNFGVGIAYKPIKQWLILLFVIISWVVIGLISNLNK